MRGLRGIFAGILAMEAIVVGLALLVVGRLGGGLGGPAGWYTAGLAVAMVVGACVQRRPWGLGLALALQSVSKESATPSAALSGRSGRFE